MLEIFHKTWYEKGTKKRNFLQENLFFQLKGLSTLH